MDGDISDWAGDEPALINESGELYLKYDERYIYLMVKRTGLNGDSLIYIPMDTTQKSGAYYCDNYDIRFDRAADFVLIVNGDGNSRLIVQRRYELIRAIYAQEVYGIDAYLDPPDKDDTRFEPIRLMLQTAVLLNSLQNAGEMGMVEFVELEKDGVRTDTYETGALTLGNANPESKDYNSLADFCYGRDCVEIKLPWQLLNFANPAEMMIHDDYYEHYGVELTKLKEMSFGLGTDTDSGEVIPLSAQLKLKGWGRIVTYHERLKPVYYAFKELWAD